MQAQVEQAEVKVRIEERRIQAFCSVYEISRCYGGHEEGGWWYDVYEHVGISFPFNVMQSFEILDEMNMETGQYEESMVGPAVIVPEQMILFRAVENHLKTMFDFATTHRFSCAPRGEDYMMITEYEIGQFITRGRPRYE